MEERTLLGPDDTGNLVIDGSRNNRYVPRTIRRSGLQAETETSRELSGHEAALCRHEKAEG